MVSTYTRAIRDVEGGREVEVRLGLLYDEAALAGAESCG